MAAEEVVNTSPEELVYRSCYAPADLAQLLATAETRSRIRRLPPAQLYFGLRELSEADLLRLLPHITEEQWEGVLDLDLWDRDEADSRKFVQWNRFLPMTQDAVARKLLRASPDELWEMTFRDWVTIIEREDEEFPVEPPAGRSWVETPDRNYLLVLPEDPELERLLGQIVQRLYDLNPVRAALLLASSTGRTRIELQEEGYQARRRRVEMLGFQDYFEAVEVYTYLPPDAMLPVKPDEFPRQVSTLPALLQEEAETGDWLFFSALSGVAGTGPVENLLEELFLVCNRVLSAERISPADPDGVRRTITRTLNGINLGLEFFSEASIGSAVEGLRKHYLQSFFQVGFSRLRDLRRAAREAVEKESGNEGTAREAFLGGLLEDFPILVTIGGGGTRRTFIRSLEVWQQCLRRVDGEGE